jgi:preprotein translocase subunit YajC
MWKHYPMEVHLSMKKRRMEKIKKGDAVVIMGGLCHGSGIVIKNERKRSLVHTTEQKVEWYDKKDLDTVTGSVWETRIREAVKESDAKQDGHIDQTS